MLDELGLLFPIIQAPMAGVSTPALAAAVSNAGGLGSLGLGSSTVAQAGAAIEATRAATNRPFSVNVFCHRPARRDADAEAAWIRYLTPVFVELGVAAPTAIDEIYRTFVGDDEALRLLLDSRPAMVSFHFGLPTDGQIAALRDAGIRMVATATSLREAAAIEAAGLDGIVAQGIEAGGHRGVFDPDAADEGLSTLVLTRLLVSRTRLPVIAAGGIMDGAGVRAALNLGAVAAQLGTAFILCPESAANAGYRAMLDSERAIATRLTSAISGRPARGIVNRFMEIGDRPGRPPPAGYPVAYDLAKQLHAAAARQGIEAFGAHWAGQGASLAREMPAADLIRLLAGEAGLLR